MTNYPNDPNQPGRYGQQPNDGAGDPQYGNNSQGGYPSGDGYGQTPADGSSPYGSPQYGEPGSAPQYGQNPQYGGTGNDPKYGGGGGLPGQVTELKNATLIMILGILSIPCCGVFTGVPAIIMGRSGMKEIDRSGGALGGRSKVQAGFICGIIGTVLTILGAIRYAVTR